MTVARATDLVRMGLGQGTSVIFTRRQLLKYGAGAGVALYLPWELGTRDAIAAALTGPSLPGTEIPKYEQPLIIPPAMPTAPAPSNVVGVEYYEIAVRQFEQQILPAGLPPTTVWSYGSASAPGTVFGAAASITRRSRSRRPTRTPVRVKWINDLVDPATGNYLPHLLPIDQTLHWANPPGGPQGRDGHGIGSGSVHGPGSDRHPSARRACDRGERRVRRGLVSCPRRRTFRAGSRGSGPSTRGSGQRPRRLSGKRGRPATPSSSTTMTRGHRLSGTTTTRWG